MLALRGLKCAAGCAQRVVLAPGYRGREPRIVMDTRPHGTWVDNLAYYLIVPVTVPNGVHVL
jgi:hypothetical protein